MIDLEATGKAYNTMGTDDIGWIPLTENIADRFEKNTTNDGLEALIETGTILQQVRQWIVRDKPASVAPRVISSHNGSKTTPSPFCAPNSITVSSRSAPSTTAAPPSLSTLHDFDKGSLSWPTCQKGVYRLSIILSVHS